MKARPGQRQTTSKRRLGEADKKYRWARWARLRLKILARDNGLCQLCQRDGIVSTGNQIDHIVPADSAMELFWIEENLQTLCRKCHAKKTRRGE